MDVGDAVGGQVHRPPEGYGSAVSGHMTNHGGLRKGDRIKGGGQEETDMVDTGAHIGGAEEQPGGGFQGGPTGTSGQG